MSEKPLEEQVRHFEGSRKLMLASVTDSDATKLNSLVNIQQLERLVFSDSPGFTGLGLKNMVFPCLKFFRAAESSFCDEALECLAGSPNLEVLDLRGTAVLGKGLTHLVGLNRLFDVGLEQTPLTGDGLQYVSSPMMTFLRLASSAITDEGLQHIVGSCGSEDLFVDLNDSSVSAVGVRALLRMNPGIKSIWVRGTKLTLDDATQLDRDFPYMREVYVEGD